MKKHLIKYGTAWLCAVLLLSLLPFSALAFTVEPQFRVDGVPAATLSEAFELAAETGSVITQNGQASDFVTVSSPIEVTKDVTLFLGKDDYCAQPNRIAYERENETMTDAHRLLKSYVLSGTVAPAQPSPTPAPISPKTGETGGTLLRTAFVMLTAAGIGVCLAAGRKRKSAR